MAEGTGFEPAKLLTCWFSRPVPSTTRPPFHVLFYQISAIFQPPLTKSLRCDIMSLYRPFGYFLALRKIGKDGKFYFRRRKYVHL